MKSRNGGTSTALDKAVNNLQGKLKCGFLNSYPHHTVPGYNLSINPNVDNYDEENITQLFHKFPYESNLPRPLLPPARIPQCVLRNDDPGVELLSIKSVINDDISRITEHHEKYRRGLKIFPKKSVKWKKNDENIAQTYVPRYVAELAEIMESDPDPQFEGEYNWYYTGGSLDHLNFSGKNILLFPYAEELVAVPIVEKSGSSWKPNLKIAAKCDLESDLYEIRRTDVTSGSSCRILGRQKYSCSLYSLSEVLGILELDEIHMQSSPIPYISADLNPIESNKYCLANSNRFVELWDLNKAKYLSSTLIPTIRSIPDNWMSTRFQKSDSNLITIVDRCCLYYLDTRTPLEKPNLTLCPKDNMEICESLSLNTPSEHNSYYQYLGSYHSLLLCDSRFENSCAVQKWTHQFKSPPLFCTVVDRNDEEVIALSSQLSGETSVILNTWTNETHTHSYCLPRMASSVLETLKECQAEGKCLDPSMITRLELCNAGTTANLNDRNEVTFFTQNSIGDIFYQCITNEEKLRNTSEVNKKSLLALDAWEKACLRQSKTVKPLVVSEKANMKYILDAMKDPKLSLTSKEPEARNFLPQWFQSMEKLNSYVDILAPELLTVWDVRQDTVSATVTPHQKVLSWLEKKTSSQGLSQTQEETPMFNTTNDTLSQELISVSQNIQENYTQNNTQIEQIDYDIPESVTTRKRVSKKKLKGYISGF